MIIFTLKERRLVDEAVHRYGDEHERTVWRDWTLNHPAVRYDLAAAPDDGTGRMPSYVAEVLVAALARLERALQSRIVSKEISDEEAADLCNDVLEIQSTAEAIRASA